MKKINNTTLILIVISAVLAILLVKNKIEDKKTEYNSTTILSKIVNIQELTLVKYNYTGVIGYKDTMKVMNINVPFTEKFFLLKYNGYVKAGIDLSSTKIKVSGKNVEITISKPKIMETVIDEKTIRVYDESKNPFNPTSITEYNRAIIREKNTIARDAINQGILNSASQQANIILLGILKEMGFKNIKITEVQAITLPEKH